MIFRILRKFFNNKSSGNEEIKLFIKEHLPENPIIVEAGAHIGNDTIEMSRIWPNGSIHAFEPVPNILKKLKNRTKHLPNVTIYDYALSNNTGSAEIFVSSGTSDGSSSLLAPKEHLKEHPDVTFKDKVIVNTISIDDWASKYSIEKVDFLWLDMQGFEHSTLKASEKILEKVKVIYTEVSLVETYKGVPLYLEFKEWMNNKGFSVLKEDFRWSDMGNVLFVKK